MHQPISRKVELYKPRNGEAGTETCRVVKPSSVKTKESPSPCGFTYGIAVYGPVCTVVWEGRAGNRSPYPDSAHPELVIFETSEAGGIIPVQWKLIETKAHQTLTVKITSATKFLKNKKPSSLSEMKTGDHVVFRAISVNRHNLDGRVRQIRTIWQAGGYSRRVDSIESRVSADIVNSVSDTDIEQRLQAALKH